MKQVTGNSISPVIASNSILSIRLSPDGFYFVVVSGVKIIERGALEFKGQNRYQAVSDFYAANEFLKYNYKETFVCLDTNRNVTIPAQEADVDTEDMLRLCGMALGEKEQVARTEVVSDIYVAAVVGSDIFNFMRAAYSENLRFTHPLLRVVAGKFEKPTIRVNYTTSFVHIVLFAGGLMAMESIPYHNDDEIVYYIHKIMGNYPAVKKFSVLISGVEAKVHKRKLSKYFPSCSIEKLEPYQCV